MELEQQYSIVHIVERLEEIVEDEEQEIECYRDALETVRVWLRKERVDRREVPAIDPVCPRRSRRAAGLE